MKYNLLICARALIVKDRNGKLKITLGKRRRIHMKKRSIRFLRMGIGFSTAVFF